MFLYTLSIQSKRYADESKMDNRDQNELSFSQELRSNRTAQNIEAAISENYTDPNNQIKFCCQDYVNYMAKSTQSFGFTPGDNQKRILLL